MANLYRADGFVVATARTLKLTARQADFLLLCMKDYIDVSEDKSVVRTARQIRDKLISAPSARQEKP